MFMQIPLINYLISDAINLIKKVHLEYVDNNLTAVE